MALLVAACGGKHADSADGKTRIISVDGSKVSTPEKPKRIVVLWQPTLAAVTELGFHPVGTAGEKGDDLAPYLPAGYPAKSLTLVSNTSAPDDINLECHRLFRRVPHCRRCGRGSDREEAFPRLKPAR